MFINRISLATLALVFACCFLPSTVSAFGVSPAIQELNVNPGETKQVNIRVQNDLDLPRAYTFSIQKFIPKGNLGQQEFLPITDTSGLPEWLYVDRPILQLNAHEAKNIPVTLRVPSDAKAGGYYAALFVTQQVDISPGANEEVAILPRTGVLFLVTVNGSLVQDFQISKFAPEPQHTNRLPIEFTTEVENTGNVHLAPTGELRIKNMFGQTVSKQVLNPSEARILPGSKRQFRDLWSKTDEAHAAQGFFNEMKNEWMNFAFGRYEATLSVEANGMMQTQTASFYVWPWRLMTVAGSVIILVLVFFFVWFRNYRRKLLVG